MRMLRDCAGIGDKRTDRQTGRRADAQTEIGAVVQRRTDEVILDYGVEATNTWWALGHAKASPVKTHW